MIRILKITMMGILLCGNGGNAGCTLTRRVTIYGGKLRQPLEGVMSAKLGSGSGEITITTPDGEMSGRVTFYWGSGYHQEAVVVTNGQGGFGVGFSQGGQRMCQASLMGASGRRMECRADADPNTGHGTGLCYDQDHREYTWHF